jgi:hypothetical protein
MGISPGARNPWESVRPPRDIPLAIQLLSSARSIRANGVERGVSQRHTVARLLRRYIASTTVYCEVAHDAQALNRLKQTAVESHWPDPGAVVGGEQPLLSIVIPVLNEEVELSETRCSTRRDSTQARLRRRGSSERGPSDGMHNVVV